MDSPQLETPREVELMRQALRLAAQGRGHVEPNPMVACIIHRNGRIIGEGCHRQFGQPHAEPDALDHCTEPTAGAAAVVTLEPCCHTDKKTAPCVPSLIAAGLRRIVIANVDPNPQVAGRGVAQLRAAGIEVVTGVLQAESRQLNAPFFSLMQQGRPYVTLKWAQTSDGQLHLPGPRPLSISCPESSLLVHELRTRSDAIAVSANTVISDDPILSARGASSIRIPIRVILDAHRRTPLSARLLRTAAEIPTHVFCLDSAQQANADALSSAGVNVHRIRAAADGHLDMPTVLRKLAAMRITHLLIEPGPRLAQYLIDGNLADRLWVIQSPKPLPDRLAPSHAPIRVTYPVTAQRRLGIDIVSEHLNPDSPVFFAPLASPDFLL